LFDEQCAARRPDVRGLVDEHGRLPKNYREFLLRWSLGRFGASQIKAEITAQISRTLEAGISPTHIDSHQHLHVFPPILPIVLEAAASASIRVIRLPIDASRKGIKAKILARFSNRVLSQVENPGHSHSRSLLGISAIRQYE